MKLQFKHQKFQADAAKAVVDVFAGQPYLTPTYMMDRGTGIFQIGMNEEDDFTGWRNQPLVPELSKRMILEQIQEIQRIYQITPSQKLEGEGYNLTIEMETGVGKTYTYIKTMFELNKHYGWSKFIVVVPSIAIREGVYKSFEVTQEHFAEEYGKKIRFFIYNSAQLTEIDRFASDNSINVMIINSQAFNARGKDARRIYMKLDEFRSRRPIDIIARSARSSCAVFRSGKRFYLILKENVSCTTKVLRFFLCFSSMRLPTTSSTMRPANRKMVSLQICLKRNTAISWKTCKWASVRKRISII